MKEFDKLIKIVANLRNLDGGCPWDIKQTHQSLIPNFIEELYESIEAIENNDYQHLAEELGDLMLHIVMQSQISKEEKYFSMEDVLSKINDKLIRRHPHVFADGYAVDANGVKKNWERIKLEEKKQTRKSAIDGIPKKMPALIVAQRMQEKAASVGFDWPNVQPAIKKLYEETKEFEDEFKLGNSKKMREELGDMIFSIVNIARILGFDAESILRQNNDKFETRFKKMEKYFKDENKSMLNASLEQLDEKWEIAKKEEK